MRRWRMTAGVLGALAAMTSLAHADDVSEACDQVLHRISTVKGGLVRQMPDTFEDAGKIYRGCVVTVVGDHNRAPETFPPSAAGPGWNIDREADGPDGTSYRISRGAVFCLVRGSWDGGDASDPKVIPSSLFLITARCARA